MSKTEITSADLERVKSIQKYIEVIELRFDNSKHCYNDHHKIGRLLSDLEDLEFMLKKQLN